MIGAWYGIYWNRFRKFCLYIFYTMDLDLVQHKLLRIRIQDPKKFVTDTDPDQILYES